MGEITNQYKLARRIYVSCTMPSLKSLRNFFYTNISGITVCVNPNSACVHPNWVLHIYCHSYAMRLSDCVSQEVELVSFQQLMNTSVNGASQTVARGLTVDMSSIDKPLNYSVTRSLHGQIISAAVQYILQFLSRRANQ